MERYINSNENLQFGSGRKCISAEEKLLIDITDLLGSWLFRICVLIITHFKEIFILLCATVILYYWRARRSKPKEVCKCWRLPPDVLYEIAVDSHDKVNSDFCMEILKEYDYDVNYRGAKDKLSLFMCACVGGNSEVIMFMMKRGADFKSCTAHGDSVLYLATYGYLHSHQPPNLHVLSMLIEQGCDINQSNSSGFTVLHQAAGKGNLCLTQYFILKGADPGKSNQNGILPHHMALIEGHHEVAQFLMDRLKPLSTKLLSTA